MYNKYSRYRYYGCRSGFGTVAEIKRKQEESSYYFLLNAGGFSKGWEVPHGGISKNYYFLIVNMLSKIWVWVLGSEIWKKILCRNPNPGVKKAPDPGFATLSGIYLTFLT
jgi:hypothetical protein